MKFLKRSAISFNKVLSEREPKLPCLEDSDIDSDSDSDEEVCLYNLSNKIEDSSTQEKIDLSFDLTIETHCTSDNASENAFGYVTSTSSNASQAEKDIMKFLDKDNIYQADISTYLKETYKSTLLEHSSHQSSKMVPKISSLLIRRKINNKKKSCQQVCTH